MAEEFVRAWSAPVAPHQPANAEHKLAVVMVEPRRHPLIAPVMRNVIDGLQSHPDARGKLALFPIVFTSPEALPYVQEQFHAADAVTAHFVTLPTANMTVSQYNQLFHSKQFWEAIPFEDVLIIQVDGFLQNPRVCILDFLRLGVSMLGGLYNFVAVSDEKESRLGRICTDHGRLSEQLHASPSLPCGINGGVSLRKRSVMLECIERVSVEDIRKHRERCGMNSASFQAGNEGEDTFFQNAIDVLRLPLPRVYDCMRFANNLYYPQFLDEGDVPMFVHGWDKPFFHQSKGSHRAQWELITDRRTSEMSNRPMSISTRAA